MNYNVKLNLSKLRRVKYLQKDDDLYICIPMKANQIFNGQKGMYLELTAFELKNRQFNESHLVKLSVPSKVLKELSDEQKRELPIVGSLSEFGSQLVTSENTINENFTETPKNCEIYEVQDDFLPF